MDFYIKELKQIGGLFRKRQILGHLFSKNNLWHNTSIGEKYGGIFYGI